MQMELTPEAKVDLEFFKLFSASAALSGAPAARTIFLPDAISFKKFV